VAYKDQYFTLDAPPCGSFVCTLNVN